MDPNTLKQDLLELQRRFLRINSTDPKLASRDLAAAEIVGGKLLWQLEEAGLISMEGLEKPTPKKEFFFDDEAAYGGDWTTCMMLLPRVFPQLSSNALHFRSKEIEGPHGESIRIGHTDHDGWRIRAENYAQACGVLADELFPEAGREAKKSGHSETPLETYVTLSMMSAIVQKSKDTIERLWKEKKVLPPPHIKGGNGKSHEWKWNEVRPFLEEEYNRPLPDKYPSIQIVR